MKGRTMKLKEAHKNPNGKKSFCSIIWDLQAQHLFTSSSSDNSISVHDLLQPSNPPKSLGDHTAGVTALALSPDSKCLASGSVDRSVKIYSYPGWVYKRSITRFTLAIRSVAFNKSGSMLAAAGDDDGIKLINMVDFSISRVLKGHKGSVTGLAFDPNGDYLASIDSTGNVIIWELSSGKQLHNLKGVATNFGYETSVPNVLSWSPDGECLAVPGSFNDVVMYDRDTAKVVFKIQGEHENNVCFVSWSPNGEYIATSGFDNQVMIWEINSKKKEVINNQRFDCRICCLAWKPNGNALAVIDEMGKYGVWDSVVPIQMKSPSDGAPSHKGSRLSHIEDDGDDQPSNSGNLNDVGGDCCNESEPVGRKRFRKYQLYEDMDEDSNDQVGSLHKVEPRKKAFRNSKEGLNDGVRDQSIMRSIAPEMQEAFQPGSTPVQAGTRRFLCYNMLGSITTIENAGNSHIEVDFHDTGRRSRVPKMTDYFGFTMAALNENGSVFANPCKGEKNMSTLMYRPFSSWANNSEWSMRFKGEEVKVVALGTGWVAAVTSLNYLRIFTEGGLQRYIISLDGPVVTASGFKDELAVVTHASHPLPSYGQMLEFEVFKISQLFNRSQPFKRSLPLTPGSRLTWFGFSEEGRLSSYDSKGVLRAFTNAYWVPLFSASEEKDSVSKEEDIAIEEKDTASKEKDSNSEEKKSDSYWIVGLNAIKLFCITCKSPNSYPLVSPKPVLTLFDLSFPLASSDLGADDLEKEFIFSDLYKSQTEIKIDEMIAAGLDTTREEDEAFELEASLDRCIIRLIGVCCTGDKLVRATELSRLLTHEKSLKGCIKLATTLKLPALAERFNAILEERLLNEAMEITSRPSLTPNVEQAKIFEHPQPIKMAEDTLPSSKKPSTTFQRPGKAESRGDKTEAKRSTSEKRVNPPSRALNNQDSLSIGRSTSINEGAEKIKEGGSTVQAQRPSNPFAKKSTKEENKPSVFDTITISKAKANNGSKHGF